MNIKILIEYDGTGYHGWQRQKNALSIQEVLEDAISSITRETIKIIGAGRTDARVHAIGQVANFRSNTKIPIEKLPYAINSRLPNDIAVKDAKIVPEDFHARFSAKSKIYIYRIYNAPFPSPLLRNYTYFFPLDLDINAISKALPFFVGTHDFAAFMASGSDVKSTVRNIERLEAHKRQDLDLIEFEIQANGFLYNMVRIIAGTLLEVGLGKIKPGEINSIIKSKRRENAGRTLPPQGLCLREVIY